MTWPLRLARAVRHFFAPTSVSDAWLQSQRLIETKRGWDGPPMRWPLDRERRPADVVPIERGRR